MDLDFGFVEHNGLTLLVYRPWWEQGVLHGMTTSQLSLVSDAARGEFDIIKRALGVSRIALPLQCHGSDVVDVRQESVVSGMLATDGDLMRRRSGDALAVPTEQLSCSDVMLYGILTADCVPIVVRGDDGYVLIHAGWRGLANGIIGKALRYLGAPREALIFASAGPDRYEVEMDVIEAIGDSAVYRPAPLGLGKYLLDTVETSIKQLESSVPECSIHAARVCTISDIRFHSFRREGSQSGRSMSFVVP